MNGSERRDPQRLPAAGEMLSPGSSNALRAHVAYGRSIGVLLVCCTIALGVAWTSSAALARKPTRTENREIRHAVLKVCGVSQRCIYQGALISARDRRFAFASAKGGNYSPQGILKRRARPSRRWRFVIQQSGGPDRCSNYRKLVPIQVLREFHIGGVNDVNQYGRC